MPSLHPTALFSLVRSIAQFLEGRSFTPTPTAVEPIFRDVIGPGFSETEFGFANFADLYHVALASPQDTPSRPAISAAATTSGGRSIPRPPPLETVFALLREIVTSIEQRDQRPLAAMVKPFLRDALGGSFSEADYGFRAFKDFSAAAAEAGYISVQQGLYDFVLSSVVSDTSEVDPVFPWTKGTPPFVPDRSESPLLNEALQLLVTVVASELDAGESTFAGRIKPILVRASAGSFNERALGFGSFSDFLEEAEQRGLVRLQSRPGMGVSVTDIYLAGQGPVDFSDLKFGYSSASAESVRNPSLLIEGFYDPRDVAKRLREGSEFLVLGYKGSGKSSIGEHLRLVAQSRHDLFVDLIDLRDFPLESLKTIVGSADASPQLLQMGWSWLLLLRAFQSLCTDQAGHPRDEAVTSEVARQLGKQGLLPSRSVKALSLKSAEISLHAGLASILDVTAKATFEGNTGALDVAISTLREVISTYRTDSRHLLVVDGVDELLSPDPGSFVAIAALLDQVDDLNAHFYRNGSAVKIVMMCRSDLYERIPNPNKNKLRQDFAILLQWFGDMREESELFKLILWRARLSGYVGDDPLGDFFPRRVRFEKDQESTKDLLISQTRHTPRDLISALTAVQRHSDGPSVSFSAIRRGLEAYSHDYFVPELKDELHGYLPPDYIDVLFGLMSSVGRRVFRLSDLGRLAERRGLGDLDLLKGLQILFECSALGQEVTRGTKVEHRFRYQFPNLAVNPDLPFVIHRGAWRALSLEERETSAS